MRNTDNINRDCCAVCGRTLFRYHKYEILCHNCWKQWASKYKGYREYPKWLKYLCNAEKGRRRNYYRTVGSKYKSTHLEDLDLLVIEGELYHEIDEE